MKFRKLFVFFSLVPLMLALTARKTYSQQTISAWVTGPDETVKMQQQKGKLSFNMTGVQDNVISTIEIDPERKYQSIEGFGFALTGGSAQHIINMSPEARTALLKELFGKSGNAIGISYLRVSIGSSDLNDHVFSYDDLPAGQTDVDLNHFDLGPDKKDVIPVLKEILAINPDIKILGSPWSAPVWMKTNTNIQGGRLKEEYYPVYARYFAKYITEMKKQGISIDAITVQNEPFNDGNTPSMQLFAKEEARFTKDHLGPVFKEQNIKTKVILYDHNCDAPEYPISILSDPEVAKYVAGSGFHLYAGPVSAMSEVHNAFPDKGLYFTEMMAVNRNGFDIAGPVARILIDATRNWSRNVILWNLAANSKYEPHTDNGGCSICQGAVTIDGNTVIRNIAYYVIAHASRFVPVGSVRIGSTETEVLSTVAFLRPDGKIVLIVANKAGSEQKFNIGFRGRNASCTLAGKAAATYIW